jgi:hypothetical protein
MIDSAKDERAMKAFRLLPALGLISAMGAVALQALAGDTKAPAGKSKPDLSCVINVSKNADGSKPIANGGVLTYGDAKAKFHVRVTATNSGSAKALDYTVHASLWHGKDKDDFFGSFNKQEFEIAAGQSKDFESISFPFGPRSDSFKITAQLDKAKTVDELDEANNSCQIEFTTKR